MFSPKSIPTESGYIADELIKAQQLTDLDRKCLVVKQTIQDGDFTLQEALKLYEVSKSEYESFFAKNIIAELHATFASMQSAKFQAVFTIEVIASIYEKLFSSLDKNSSFVLQHFESLLKEIEEDKVLL